jgi:hypothetical protein
MARFVRTSLNVPQFNDYTRYRPYLRKDFECRCAYCGMTEASVFGIETFGVDHFKPKKLFPDLTCVYQNLYYCCNDCNRFKGPVWPSEERIAEGYFFPDPCECDPLIEHLKEEEDCRWNAITKAGTFALEVLRLNREPCLRFRRKRQSVLQRISRYRELLVSLEPVEIRELLQHALNELEIECGEYYG